MFEGRWKDGGEDDARVDVEDDGVARVTRIVVRILMRMLVR